MFWVDDRESDIRTDPGLNSDKAGKEREEGLQSEEKHLNGWAPLKKEEHHWDWQILNTIIDNYKLNLIILKMKPEFSH